MNNADGIPSQELFDAQEALRVANATIEEFLEILKGAGIHEGETVQERLKKLVEQRDKLRAVACSTSGETS